MPAAVDRLEASPQEWAIIRSELKRRWRDEPAVEVPQSCLAWAKENATIVLPTEGRQPFHPYPYQARILDDPSPRRIILKARQTGISNAVAIEALHKAITRPDSTELFVSRNQDAARNLITYCQHTINGLRQFPALTKENAGELAFANGSRIVSLPANPSTGRGLAATDVYLDEFAFTLYDALIYESIVGTIATGGRLTILSTANGRTNMFFRLWAGLEGGEWSRHEVDFRECPRFDAEWEARTRASMTRQSFAQEYGRDFITSGDVVFDAEDLAKGHQGWNPSAEGCDELVTAWDIGRRQDHTVGITLGRREEDRVIKSDDGQEKTVKVSVWHEIEYKRMLVPYPVVQTSIDDRNRRRRGRCYVESNGVGDPVIENLTTRVEPFTTTVKTKTQAIQALQLLIQQGRFKFGEAQLDRELGLYSWDDKALVQDSVMAASIAAYHIVHAPPRMRAI